MLKQFWLSVFFIVPISVFPQKNELDSVFAELNKTLMQKSIYIAQKEQRITELENIRDTTFVLERQFQLNNKLYNEYNSYIPDSAKVFLYDNIRITCNIIKYIKRCKEIIFLETYWGGMA